MKNYLLTYRKISFRKPIVLFRLNCTRLVPMQFSAGYLKETQTLESRSAAKFQCLQGVSNGLRLYTSKVKHMCIYNITYFEITECFKGAN